MQINDDICCIMKIFVKTRLERVPIETIEEMMADNFPYANQPRGPSSKFPCDLLQKGEQHTWGGGLENVGSLKTETSI